MRRFAVVKLASAEMAEKKLATRAAFGATLAELAEEGVPVVAVDADLTGSTTTKKFAAAAPENADKLFNCGIAEQNMIDVAAALPLRGMSPTRGRSPCSAPAVLTTRSATPCAIATSM